MTGGRGAGSGSADDTAGTGDHKKKAPAAMRQEPVTRYAGSIRPPVRNYFCSSTRAALAFSAAAPAVTFWKAAMACGFISLAL